MSVKKYAITVELDVQNRTTARAVVQLDGVAYAVTVVPAQGGPLQPRQKRLDDSFGEGREHAISLGPRGSGCPTCGR